MYRPAPVLADVSSTAAAAAVWASGASSTTMPSASPSSPGTHQLFDQDELQSVLGKVRSGRAVFRAPGT